MAYEVLKNTARDKYGVYLTEEQVTAIAEADPEEFAPYSDHQPGDSMDTYDRELLADRIVQMVLGPERWWPCNGDGHYEMNRFRVDFFEAALAKGIRLVPGVWPDEKDSVRFLLESLRDQEAIAKDIANDLNARFQALLARKLPVGAVIDISKPGIGNRAKVIRGRGYGQIFRVERPSMLMFNRNFPEDAQWQAQAISVTPEGLEMGRPVTLRGRLFPELEITRKDLDRSSAIVEEFAEAAPSL